MEGTETTFVMHLSYLTGDGAPITVPIAAGPDVGTNLVFGLPFIKATQMVIDVADSIADCQALDCTPFPTKDNCVRGVCRDRDT